MMTFSNFFKKNTFNSLIESNVLKTKEEINNYTQIVNDLGLVGHHDYQKNWDTLKSFLNIIINVPKNAPILDAGSSGNSAILRWLIEFGYTNLHACDLREKNKKYKSTIVNFSIQDITATNYPDAYFSAATCISVIEHGVDIYNFFAEMKRIIKPGGLLFISTDYWDQSINTENIYPYGVDFGAMKVMDNTDIINIINVASLHGFNISNHFKLQPREQCVRWDRVDREYTFIFMCFKNVVD
jgi:SAM-dependent methyltransferase